MTDPFANIADQRRWGGATYSHNGVDLVILSIFELLGVQMPSYLDVGAHHPTVISNTALLYSRGCRGVNVEANPNLIQNFYRQRPDDVNLNVGVGPVSGEMEFYCVDRWSGRNSFSKQAIEDFIRDYPSFKITEVLKIPVMSLNEVVGSTRGGKFPDFLSIDIEQLDYEVLKSTDFSLSHPRVVCAETIKYDGTSNYPMFRDMMLKKGFVTYCRLVADTLFIWYEDAKFLDLISPPSHSPCRSR